MRPFNHLNAKSLDEAIAALQKGDANVLAGGVDLLGTLKDNISPEYPRTVVNLKTIPGLDYIKEEDGVLKIGATTRLADIGRSELVKKAAPALAEAADATATPNIREMGTLGGNIAQLPRCWYFRKLENRFYCDRKGGNTCYAIQGDNRYHSIFGGLKPHASPCTQECPAGTDIPAYMAELRKGNWDAAAQIILKANPLPMFTARICPHPCQDKCNQCEYGDGVNIHAVERSLADYIMEHADVYYAAPAKETGKKVAIIGGGPGGLTAAYYLRKAGHSVTVFERQEKIGGVMRYGVPHYRLPKDIVDFVVDAFTKMGIEFKTGVTVGKDITVEEIDEKFDGVFFGTGAWKQPLLGIGGEELALFGLNFLTEVNTYLQKAIGKNVLVCGGGNVAMDVALTAKRLGADKVTLICLEKRHEMPASKEEIERAEAEGVEIVNAWGLGGVITDDKGQVIGFDAKRCTSVRDANGRFNPVYDENERWKIDCDYIILATGQAVDISFLGDKFLEQLKSARGLINVDLSTFKTSRKGMYAAGDVATGPNIAIRAINGGRIAAQNMSKELGVEIPVQTMTRDFVHCDTDGIDEHTATPQPERPQAERTLVDEDAVSFTADQFNREIHRCMNCACYAVNPSDTAPALIALGAKVVTTKRTLDAEEFFQVNVLSNTKLDKDEIITEIQIPVKAEKSTYKRFAFRKSIDFPVVNVAISETADKQYRVCLNAVAPVPHRCYEAEKVLNGKDITPELAEAAGEAAVIGAEPFEANKYKIQIAKTLVKRTLLGM